ncbi:MAG: quinoprotein glucose dehydrogenase [Meiothermus sp.]
MKQPALSLILTGLLATALVFAEGSGAQRAAWFSPAQAQRGQALVFQQCAGCHGARLEGRYGPLLSGPRFLSKWGGRSAQELRTYIASRMPLGRAGTLSEAQTLDLVAYILQANGYPSGGQELKPDSLPQIELTKP